MPRLELGAVIASPDRVMTPSVGAKKPARMFKSVDLPHPEGPKTDISSPSLMSKLMFFNASTLPPLGNSKVIDTLSMIKPDIVSPEIRVKKRAWNHRDSTPNRFLAYMPCAAVKYDVLTNAS